MIRMLVCGGRDFGLTEAEREFIHSNLDSICLNENWIVGDSSSNWLPSVFVISGKASGVDSVAIDWAVINWCDFKEFPADWARYGKSAGYKRNVQMLEEGRPDVVVAFRGGKGTKMMTNLAEKTGVRVIKIDRGRALGSRKGVN